MFSLRQIKGTDREIFAKWWRDDELIGLAGGTPGPMSDHNVDKNFNRILIEKIDQHFVMEADGRAVGHVAIISRGDGWFELQVIIGEKNDRGRGYGSQAMAELLKKAANKGIGRIFLEVKSDNAPAVRLYQKFGFQKNGFGGQPGDDFSPQTFRMELFLTKN